MTNYEFLETAIKETKIVVLTYDHFERWCCPHVLGTKDGVRQCLVYQFAGGSKRGLKHDGHGANWRCLEVNKMSGMRLEDGAWHTARNYSKALQQCVDIAHARI
jgi:hypothetical protein